MVKCCKLACFKMTMGFPNIMTFWHNILHDITVWMQKNRINEQKLADRQFFKVIKGKHGFYNGGKTEKIEIPFLARQIDQYWSIVYQKMQNSNIWGGMFPKKSWVCQYFQEIILTLDFWSYNTAPLYPQKSEIMIILWKYWQNQLSLGNIPPKCSYSASFGVLWSNISQFFLPKMGFQIFHFSPIIKFMLSLYKLWQIVNLSISVH